MAIYLEIRPSGVRQVVIQGDTKDEAAHDLVAWLLIEDLVDEMDRVLIEDLRETLELLIEDHKRAAAQEALAGCHAGTAATGGTATTGCGAESNADDNRGRPKREGREQTQTRREP